MELLPPLNDNSKEYNTNEAHNSNKCCSIEDETNKYIAKCGLAQLLIHWGKLGFKFVDARGLLSSLLEFVPQTDIGCALRMQRKTP